ncbi:MAG: cytochrome c3 family protein [Candidatus Magnetomorum sp.]|nr:cytochrome c3 family protein [Candidatus Magnetomorum sp.]
MKKFFFMSVFIWGMFTSVSYASIKGDFDNNGQLDLKDCISILQSISGTIHNPSTDDEYVIFAWNDLGMHYVNATYNKMVILPPYNTVLSQAVKRGPKPVVSTNNLSVNYSIVNNTYSYGKQNYGQFWDQVQTLFGVSLAQNTGLNLVDPDIHNGLSGSMLSKGDHFVVNGIPVTPVDDNLVWNAYQQAEIKLMSGSTVLAETKATVPVSDEVNCGMCHRSEADPFDDILKRHDTIIDNQPRPVLCAKCHGSPVLGLSGPGSSGKYLSEAIHGKHASKGAGCYHCHPGIQTKFNRSTNHTDTYGDCITCHGDLDVIANSIANNGRMPWVDEPQCKTCHSGIALVDTGNTLFKNAKGHGGLYCSACHGSPHAMVPSAEDKDNYQAKQYQNGKAKTMGSCGVCHENSRGEENKIAEFDQVHGGENPMVKSACNVCHTSVSASDKTKWPHYYQWKNNGSSRKK